VTGDDEIWAYGLRNAWRCAFDQATGDLYMADVGQNAIEEISFQPGSSTGGENYGWRCYEGNNAFNTGGCPPQSELVFPIWTYSHSGGNCSITGGEVYRGCAIPELDGTYFYADYCSGQIWSLQLRRRQRQRLPEPDLRARRRLRHLLVRARRLRRDVHHPLGGSVEQDRPRRRPIEDCDNNGVEDACQIAAGNPPACGCNAADIAEPFGVLDLGDVQGFVGAFLDQDPLADIAEPFGVFDLGDLQAFVGAFTAGCP
jgi:hypothetical protein